MSSHCSHDFFEIPFSPAVEEQAGRVGILVMCAFCGERRVLWADGELTIRPPR